KLRSWPSRGESNTRPHGSEPCALSAELRDGRLVSAAGFDPASSGARDRRSSRLSYTLSKVGAPCWRTCAPGLPPGSTVGQVPPTLTERSSFGGQQWPTGSDSGLGLRLGTIPVASSRAGVTSAFLES